MNLITPTELSRQMDISKQAVFNAIDDGIIPFTLQGKKKLIDLDNKSVQGYIRDNNRQREHAKKNDIYDKPSEKREKKTVDKQIPSDLPDLDMHEMTRRSKFAEMRKKELQVQILEKNYLPTDFIEGVYITYLERFNSIIERYAATYIKDTGKKILESGEVLPEHIESFTQKILETIHNNKKSVNKEVRNYEPHI